MKLNSISGVTYYVKDIEETAKFYDTLGFRFGKREEHHVTIYLNWFWIEFYSQEEKIENKGEGVLLGVKVEDADEFHKGLLAKGLKPESEPQSGFGGRREFVLRDPDGYQLLIFSKK